MTVKSTRHKKDAVIEDIPDSHLEWAQVYIGSWRE